MKKIRTIAVSLLILLCMVAVAGCTTESEPVTESDGYKLDWASGDRFGYDVNFGVYADPQTGVTYLIGFTYRKFGITPMFNADGSPMTLDQWKEARNAD